MALPAGAHVDPRERLVRARQGQKRRVDVMAEALTLQRGIALQDDVAYVQGQQLLLTRRTNEVRTQEGALNNVATCRYTDVDIQGLQDRLSSGGCPPELVAATFRKMTSSPGPLSNQARVSLSLIHL